MQPDITYCTQLLIHVQRNTKTSIKNVPNDSERLRNREGSYEMPEKVLQSKCNFERKKLDMNDGCGLSWLVLKDRAKKTTKKVLLPDLFHKFKESDGFASW